MKTPVLTQLTLLSVLVIQGCSHLQASHDVDAEIFQSLLPNPIQQSPWRLDAALQGGGLGGAAIRAAAVEHVVRKKAPADKLHQVAASNNNPKITEKSNSNPVASAVERAWIKFCQHQLDMSAADHTLVQQNSMPAQLRKHACHPNSLLK